MVVEGGFGEVVGVRRGGKRSIGGVSVGDGGLGGERGLAVEEEDVVCGFEFRYGDEEREGGEGGGFVVLVMSWWAVAGGARRR